MSTFEATGPGVLVDLASLSRDSPESREHGEPGDQEILVALQRVTASPAFAATDRTRRLLNYLCKESLEGRKDRIKAYSIATEVLGRPESFDPQKDPIVRIEAARLRRELEHYYLTEGRDDAVIISIPKGAYVPQFLRRTSGSGQEDADQPKDRTTDHGEGDRSPVRESRAVTLLLLAGFLALALGINWYILQGPERDAAKEDAIHVPALIVKPLTDLTQSAASGALAQGLTEHIIEATSRFREIAVISADERNGDVPTADARYEFGGSLRLDANQLLVRVRLADRLDGRVIWAESFDVEPRPDRQNGLEREIANQVAAKIASPAGFVFERERQSRADVPPGEGDAYLCTLSAYAYRSSLADDQFPAVRDCLEKAVSQHPSYATAWALLSLAYIDEARFLYPAPAGEQTEAVIRAYRSARRAVELDPVNLRGQQALMMALYFRGEHEAAVDVGEKALSMNPNDVEFKAEFGYRLALSGNWKRGCELMQQALDSSARKTSYSKSNLAVCAYMRGDVKAAATLIEGADIIGNPIYHVLAAAILVEDGQLERAAESRIWLERSMQAKLPDFLRQLTERLIRKEDRLRFVRSLEKAGLPFPE